MKMGSAIVVWMAATYSADRYLFFGLYYDTALKMLRQIIYRLV